MTDTNLFFAEILPFLVGVVASVKPILFVRIFSAVRIIQKYGLLLEPLGLFLN